MDIEIFRNYCLSLPGVTEETPFGNDVLVYKVCGKMFALTDVISFESINVKCDPENAIELRERYSAVLPGYHMNKQHWNTILMNYTIANTQILEWVNDSYNLVVKKLPQKLKIILEQQYKS